MYIIIECVNMHNQTNVHSSNEVLSLKCSSYNFYIDVLDIVGRLTSLCHIQVYCFEPKKGKKKIEKKVRENEKEKTV